MSRRDSGEWMASHADFLDAPELWPTSTGSRHHPPPHRWQVLRTDPEGSECPVCGVRRWPGRAVAIYQLPSGRLVGGGEPACKPRRGT
jgi:hypothetical protein